MTRPPLRRLVALVLLASVPLACGGDDGDSVTGPDWVGDITAAVAAVEEELGAPQQYFEVTANAQLTNVFVAENDATEAVPYLYVDGQLEPPGPALTGAGGNTFAAAAIDFDDAMILSKLAEELPDATIDALSVEGGPDGAVRFVVSVRSEAGGVLDIVVSSEGEILSVTPL